MTRLIENSNKSGSMAGIKDSIDLAKLKQNETVDDEASLLKTDFEFDGQEDGENSTVISTTADGESTT